nr:DUF1841 family protein [Gammaproteobacteria bacterium]
TDPHYAEHQMMHVITKILWQAQQTQQLPSDAEYLEKLQSLIK